MTLVAYALVTSWQMKPPPSNSDARRKGSALDNLREGFAYIRRTPHVAGLLWLPFGVQRRRWGPILIFVFIAALGLAVAG